MKITNDYLILSESEYIELAKVCELITSGSKDPEVIKLTINIINSMLPKNFSFSFVLNPRSKYINEVLNIYNDSNVLLWVVREKDINLKNIII